jgi:hypothetical protein
MIRRLAWVLLDLPFLLLELLIALYFGLRIWWELWWHVWEYHIHDISAAGMGRVVLGAHSEDHTDLKQ